MKKLMSLSLAMTAVAAFASEADLARLDHLDRWQWTKDNEVCEAVLQTNQVVMLSSGARVKYDRQLKAAVEGYDAWESERQKHLASLTDEERKAYKAKCEKSKAEREANNIHRFEFELRRAKEVAEKLALARRQLAEISAGTPRPEVPAMSEILEMKVKWIEEFGEWADRHLHGLSREVNAYKRLDANATQDEREVSKFKIRLELWDMERDLSKVEMIKSTMSKTDLLAYEQMKKEKEELAKMKDPHRFEWGRKFSGARTGLVDEAKSIIDL